MLEESPEVLCSLIPSSSLYLRPHRLIPDSHGAAYTRLNTTLCPGFWPSGSGRCLGGQRQALQVLLRQQRTLPDGQSGQLGESRVCLYVGGVGVIIS